MKVIKFLLTDIAFDSRDKREIAVLRELGHDVMVLCSGPVTETVVTNDGITIHRIRNTGETLQQPKIIRIMKILNRYLFLRRFLVSLNSDCISCHDITALCIGWSATWTLPWIKRPKLVYDSHEFEAGLNSNRSRLSVWLTLSLERFILKRTAFNMMVDDSIADEVQRLQKLKERPVVVRNLPPYWDIDEAVCIKRRKEFLELLNLDSGTGIFLIMYHGGLTRERGIENLIRVVSELDNVAAIILGNGERSYLDSLHELVNKKQVNERVLFYPAVPIEILWQYVGAVDVGVCILSNTCANHYYALPNKLSENIQSGTPVIGSDFPEISRIIKKYKIGLTCNPDDLNELTAAIEEMRSNKEQYICFKMNLATAKKELCWENEKKVLIQAYSGLIN